MDYARAFLQLLPPGLAWTAEPESDLALLADGIAVEYGRIEQRMVDLLAESHPSTVNETLEQWEQDYGLPTACTLVAQTVQERSNALIDAYAHQGDQSLSALQAWASPLGFDILSMDSGQERRMGNSFGEQYVGQEQAFVITVSVASTSKTTAEKAAFECAFLRIVHAHRIYLFTHQEA